MMKTFGLLTCLCFLVIASGQVQGQDLPPLSIEDIAGNTHQITASGDGKASDVLATVLVFINTDCPIANGYQPALRQLFNDFHARGFDMLMVHADPDLSIAAALQHQREYEIPWPIALDSEQRIARHVSAKATPEAIVIDRYGKVVYRGRIDDLYADYGKKRAQATREDLRIALESVVNQQPILQPETKAIGCVIRYHK